ncbi:phenylalanine--tRNA ligase subunit beta [archaeon]|nr:phenylalanine--tRNA ligase subunit beta [archaeon]
MPTITLDKKDLLELVGKKLSDEKLKDRISMLGTDLEHINGNEIVVEVFPDRPDMLSAEGFARALSSFVGVKKGLRKYNVKKSGLNVKVDKKVDKVRPEMVCAVVKNIKLNNVAVQSLMQVQEKIHMTFGRNRKKLSIGVYDLDMIKFPLTYTTKAKGFKFVPLEMNQEMSLREILDKHPKGVDYKQLLEGFSEYPIWIDSKKQVLSMPPIINSEKTKVTGKTKNLFIDVTGLDLRACEQALNIIITGLADRGGEIYSVNVGGKSYLDLKARKFKIDLNYVNRILGLELKDIKTLLVKMGYDYSNGFVSVPCYRVDVLGEIDIVEDIAIAYGYENFEETLSDFGCIASENEFEKFREKVCDILVGFGFLETNTYNLAKKDDQTKKMNVKVGLVEIENALNEEYNVLRAWMIPSLLDVLKSNKHYEVPQKIFEAGTVFTPKEKVRLGLLFTPANYTEVRQILDSLLSALGLEGKVKAVEHDSFIPGRVGRVSIKGKNVAYIGELSPLVLSKFELENPVSCFELNLSELFGLI